MPSYLFPCELYVGGSKVKDINIYAPSFRNSLTALNGDELQVLESYGGDPCTVVYFKESLDPQGNHYTAPNSKSLCSIKNEIDLTEFWSKDNYPDLEFKVKNTDLSIRLSGYFNYASDTFRTNAVIQVEYIKNGVSLTGFSGTISNSYGTQYRMYRRLTSVTQLIMMPTIEKNNVGRFVYTGFQECPTIIIGEEKVATLNLGYSEGRVQYEPSILQFINQWLGEYEPPVYDAENPYFDGGVSEIGGGEGNFSEDSDTPETDYMPLIGSVGTGFASIFTPSAGELKNLSELFWNSNVFTFLQNLVENITNMFTSLAMVPFEVTKGRTVSVTWLGIDTAISLTLAGAQYYEFDMGSIDMANDSRIFTSGSVLDYSPFSKLGIYLPFIGYQELDIDECRGAVINLRYRIDILSGACVAILKIGGRDLYQFTGNCLTQIPITNENMQSLVSDAVNVGIAAAGVGATGASVGADLAEAASSKSGIEFGDIANAHRTMNRAESGLASASANAVIGSKPTFNKSGAVSSSASMMAVKQPYLFLSSPRQSIPDHYQRYRGFPSNITNKLGDLSGYTVVEDIRLNGLVATSPEVAEIYDLLKKGVII